MTLKRLYEGTMDVDPNGLILDLRSRGFSAAFIRMRLEMLGLAKAFYTISAGQGGLWLIRKLENGKVTTYPGRFHSRVDASVFLFQQTGLVL